MIAMVYLFHKRFARAHTRTLPFIAIPGSRYPPACGRWWWPCLLLAWSALVWCFLVWLGLSGLGALPLTSLSCYASGGGARAHLELRSSLLSTSTPADCCWMHPSPSPSPTAESPRAPKAKNFQSSLFDETTGREIRAIKLYYYCFIYILWNVEGSWKSSYTFVVCK